LSNISPPVTPQRSGHQGDVKSDGGAVKSGAAGTVKSTNPLSDEPTGEKVSYDRNFITALRAMQDFLLKPGDKI